jgi:two-component system NtrC family sensor kinase
MESGSITIEASQNQGDVLLNYADNGKGMDAETQARIFDPFYTTKLGQGGSGLGLYIVYNLTIGVLGGKIQVISSPGAGAQFLLHLPLIGP